MEQAIFISKIENLKYVTEKYSRLYFGVEFCQHLIPSVEDLDCVLKFTSEKKMNLTLVCPFVTNKGMERLKSLLGCLINRQPTSEIAINDWGLLRWIKENYGNLNLILGRLLTKQKRGPRILNFMGKSPSAMIQHFRQACIDNSSTKDFLMMSGIKRIELDNTLQGINRPHHALPGSLYVPFAYITTTRFCLVNNCIGTVKKPLRSISPCYKECQNYTFKLHHKQMPVELLLKGNTQFFKNEGVPKNLRQLNIDRLVYQPELPI